MNTIIATSALAALAAAAPFPASASSSIDSKSIPDFQPGGPMLPTGSFTALPSFTGVAGESGIPFPSGIAIPTEGFHHPGHHHQGTGDFSGFSAAPITFAPSGSLPFTFSQATNRPFEPLTARDAELGSASASFFAPIESGSAISFPTAVPSLSSPAFGSQQPSMAVPPTSTNRGSQPSFSLPGGQGSGSDGTGPTASFFNAVESGSAISFPTTPPSVSLPAFGSPSKSGFGGPNPSFSLGDILDHPSGTAVPTGFGASGEYGNEHHHHDSATFTKGVAPTGGSFSPAAFSLSSADGPVPTATFSF